MKMEIYLAGHYLGTAVRSPLCQSYTTTFNTIVANISRRSSPSFLMYDQYSDVALSGMTLRSIFRETFCGQGM